MSVLAPHLARLRRVLQPDLLCAALWVVVLAGIEATGRRARSDVGDAVSVLVLVAFVLVTLLWHRSQPFAFARVAAERFARLAPKLRRFRLILGFDLRESPPVRSAVPPHLLWALGALAPLCVAAFAGRPYLPVGARDVLLHASAALYAVLLALLWTVLLAGATFLFFVPVVYVQAALWSSDRFGKHWSFGTVWFTAAYATLLVVGCAALPKWLPLAIVLVVLAAFAAFALAPRCPSVRMLWKSGGEADRPASFSWVNLALLLHLLYAGLFLFLVLLTRGEHLAGSVPEMPVTSFLGLVFAWSLAGAFSIESAMVMHVIVSGRRFDPARSVPLRLHALGAHSSAVRRAFRRACRRHGFRVVFSEKARRPTDVTVAVPMTEPVREGRQPWRVLAVEDLEDESVLRALERRDEIVRRRQLLRGLNRLFRAAAARPYSNGSGYWLAPHLWFVTHLSRDVDEDEGWHIGPAYRRVIPRAARAHLHAVLRALALDLLFVEDGVTFRQLKRLFSLIFETYDILGGRRPAEEMHFSGLPGIRVVIHEYSLESEERTRLTNYPEPDYEDLGRARILHVFRDRGEDEARVTEPGESDLVPAPGGRVPELVG